MIKVSRSGNHILISGCVSERDRQNRLVSELVLVTVLQTHKFVVKKIVSTFNLKASLRSFIAIC